MEFQVPQFIEDESRIFGPFTAWQFAYITFAGFFCYLLFVLFEVWLAGALTLIIAPSALASALVKINGRSVPSVAAAFLNYAWRPRLYLRNPEKESGEKPVAKPRATLRDLFHQMTTASHPIPKRENSLASIAQVRERWKNRYEIVRKITGDKEAARRVDYH